MKRSIIVTCEHGGNAIPAPFAPLFRGHANVLASHRGYDIGAAVVAKSLAERLDAPLFIARTSRLVVDLNRSTHHPQLFSEWTRTLGDAEKRRILDEHYTPHRRAVEQAIERERRRGRFVLHFAVHSFTPVLGGVERHADVALLYDPRRVAEREFSTRFLAALGREAPEWVLRRNYPYRGASDGFTKALRAVHPNAGYAGVEIEINQRLLTTGRAAIRPNDTRGLRVAESLARAFD